MCARNLIILFYLICIYGSSATINVESQTLRFKSNNQLVEENSTLAPNNESSLSYVPVQYIYHLKASLHLYFETVLKLSFELPPPFQKSPIPRCNFYRARSCVLNFLNTYFNFENKFHNQ